MRKPYVLEMYKCKIVDTDDGGRDVFIRGKPITEKICYGDGEKPFELPTFDASNARKMQKTDITRLALAGALKLQ